MVKQLNVFVENKPGRLKAITQVLSENNLNIWLFAIQDRGEFGLMKLIVDKPQAAYLILADKGFACALKEVLAVSIPDKPGNLYKLTSLLFEHKVNIVDAHGIGIASSKKGVCFLELAVKDYAPVKAILKKEGFRSLEEEDIYSI